MRPSAPIGDVNDGGVVLATPQFAQPLERFNRRRRQRHITFASLCRGERQDVFVPLTSLYRTCFSGSELRIALSRRRGSVGPTKARHGLAGQD